MEKDEARRAMREAVGRLTPAERREQAAAVCDLAMGLPEMAAARTVMAFLTMAGEIDTAPLIRGCLRESRRVYAPQSLKRTKRMIPLRLRSLEELRPGAYGILEPVGDEACRPEDIDLILVPALGFDRQGVRLGKGAGYYDRFMASPGFHATRVGIGFRCQLLAAVPREEHDLPVEIVVTADGVTRPMGLL